VFHVKDVLYDVLYAGYLEKREGRRHTIIQYTYKEGQENNNAINSRCAQKQSN